MLIQFSVQNFKTFREKATLSMVASAYDRDTREADNVIAYAAPHNLRLLKSAVVYGANASGKTKFLEAMSFMLHMVLTSANENEEVVSRVPEPFMLDVDSESKSSEFEILFLAEGVRYRYGFEMQGADIVSEWFFYKPKDTEIEVFYRSEEGMVPHPKISQFRIGRKVAKEGMVKKQMLWLTAAAKWNDPLAQVVSAWFKSFVMLSGVKENEYMGYTVSQLAKKALMATAINELLQAASIGMEEVVANKFTMDDLPAGIQAQIRAEVAAGLDSDKREILQNVARYPRYDKDGNRVNMQEFNVEKSESSGTRKYLALSGPILSVLTYGSVLLVDELDARLHPNLVCRLIEIFNSKENNPKGAQLIFNTHDTNLLSSGLFRRDQIWFTEKDRYGAATLYALSDYSPRKGEDLEKNYILGKYGAIPYLGDFDHLQKTPSQS